MSHEENLELAVKGLLKMALDDELPDLRCCLNCKYWKRQDQNWGSCKQNAKGNPITYKTDYCLNWEEKQEEEP